MQCRVGSKGNAALWSSDELLAARKRVAQELEGREPVLRSHLTFVEGAGGRGEGWVLRREAAAYIYIYIYIYMASAFPVVQIWLVFM